ncbi:hypothetical protein QJS10_CPA16g00874 [Acorus calamus]|uniref:Atos-like conserved domain-containing protein n=1 Tax=Acorus calamus TaxID=4465 RepID=A0AAV9CYZ6_ACOCL|nr:hypothetical protein QJS10_CPA16g00874 [Acorus calamus]
MDVHGLQVRKRLLSPLNGMLSPRQFNGDHLDLGRNNVFTNSGVPVGNERVFKIQGKKANIGKNGYIDAPIWSSTRCLGWSEPAADNGSNPFLFTDGPLLDNQDPCDNCLVSRGIDFCRDRSKGSNCISRKGELTLSLSPLGPTWSERMKNAEYFRVAVKDGEHCISKNMGVLLDESAPRISHSPNADERGISASNCQDIGMLGSDTEKLTPQSCPETGSKWGPESIPLPQCVKLVRSLSGASVRRSLVGSFEESLLSGRFSSGKANQRIDGFLAVLNVTGGNFIPPSQKLPFSVTSIDGDSCLLYYASIDLAGNLPSNKGRGKLKRSLSNDESRSAKSWLRVPMKGRIQLVLSNPEKTPLHTFLCSYDLSDMPAGTKTFMRQKVNLASCSSTLDPMEKEKITDMKNGRTPTMALGRSHPTQLSNEFTVSNQGNILYSMRPMQQDAKVKDDGSDILGFVYDDDSQQYDDHLEKQNVEGFPLCFPSEDHLEKQNGFNRKAVDDINKGECRKSEEGKSISLNACHLLNKKLVGSSLKLIVEQHFPADPKYFDISN